MGLHNLAALATDLERRSILYADTYFYELRSSLFFYDFMYFAIVAVGNFLTLFFLLLYSYCGCSHTYRKKNNFLLGAGHSAQRKVSTFGCGHYNKSLNSDSNDLVKSNTTAEGVVAKAKEDRDLKIM